ncbi:MAG TPA: efflux RND transporter periplasmic adaptor subunit [Bryobacteraceae bacterium]
MGWKWPVAAVVAVLILAGAVFFYRKPHAPPPKPAPTPPVVVALPAEIGIAGKIEATKVVSVPAPVDGVIEQLVADVDDDVVVGDVLARIKNPKIAAAQQKSEEVAGHARNRVAELETALIGAELEASRSDADATRARLEFEKAEKTYEREKMLMSEGITPRLVYEKAQREYDTLKAQTQDLSEAAKKAAARLASLKAELESARKAVEQRANDSDNAQSTIIAGEVRSPVEGVVIARHGAQGDPVTRKMKDFFQIAVNLTALQVVAAPQPQELQRIHAGQTAAIAIADTPGLTPGKVREIKAGQVFIDFTSPSLSIRPGMSAQVRIKVL